jgi:hypothetical protein
LMAQGNSRCASVTKADWKDGAAPSGAVPVFGRNHRRNARKCAIGRKDPQSSHKVLFSFRSGIKKPRPKPGKGPLPRERGRRMAATAWNGQPAARTSTYRRWLTRRSNGRCQPAPCRSALPGWCQRSGPRPAAPQ